MRKPIRDWKPLRALPISHLQAAGLKEIDSDIITTLSELKELFIAGTPIQNPERLAELPKLEYLSISNCSDIVNFGFLSRMTRLKSLSASDTKISDLTILKHIPELTHLILDRTPIYDLTPLEDHADSLELLSIEETTISDFRPLLRLRKLRTLWLSNLNSTNTPILLKIPSLDQLMVTGNADLECRTAIETAGVMLAFFGNS
jgi:Leucine-rich repeat (LRR) protein